MEFGVTSIISKLNVETNDPIMIGNIKMKKTSFQMLWEGRLLPTPIIEPGIRNILLIGIGVPDKIRKQWNHLESPMMQADVLYTPKVILKTPAL